MVGKFLLGVVSGGLMVVASLILAAVLAPPQTSNATAPVATPDAQEAPVAAPEATTVDAGEAAAPDVEEPKVTEPAAEPEVAPAPAEPAAKPEETAKVEEPAAPEPAAAAPAETPPAVATVDGLTAPEADPAALAEADTPALAEVPAPETMAAPAKPAETAADVAAEAAPAPPLPKPAEPEPETLVADAGEAAAPAALPEAEAPAAEVAVAEPAAPDAPAVDAEPAAPEPAAEPAPAPEPTPEPTPEPGLKPAPDVAILQPESQPEAEAAVIPAQDGMPQPAETADMPGTKPAALPGTEVAPAEPETAGSGSTFKPAPGIIRRGEGVIIGRGTDAAPADPAADPSAVPAADPNAAPADARPIKQFAATFENPDAKPPMAIVLIDRGQPDLDRAGLAALPFPVSFALDPLDPATPDHAAAYRAAGREVVMLVTGIAEGAQASDVEVAFQSMEQGLPEAVAVMDLAQPTFQNNRALAGAVVPILKAEGRGLLTRDEGLNAADQVARREDLEAAVIFRDLGTATDRVAVRRLLDRAVFKAGQDGRVSVVGEADAETVAALLEWSVEGKSATVALAPVTAVLKVD